MKQDQRIDRRSFMKNTGMAVLAGTTPSLASGARVEVADRKLRMTIETNGPARLEVRGPGGDMYQPAGAVMAPTGTKDPGPYAGHFTSPGTAVLELEPGRYTVIAEKGLEFTRVESAVDLKADQTVRLTPQRWVHMAPQGWWSGDFHIHRPPEIAELLLRAEDLNLGVFFTMWNKQNLWKDKGLPADPVLRIDTEHLATLMNEEDERGGGAWLMHNLKRPIDLSKADRWYPQGGVFVKEAKRQGGWFDSEKPIWWEAPVMAALVGIDSMGVVHNHYYQYGMMANEAWGRPRDQQLYPGKEGFSNYSQNLYHRYLNIGMRYPASAGSASGVLPGPPGYNRIYVYAPEGLSVENFYAALKAGRGFATNGPILAFTVEGKGPGDTVEVTAGRPLRVVCAAQAREPIKSIEIVANGRVVASTDKAKLESELDAANFTWLAARCTLTTEATVRLAHSSPIFLRGEKQNWDSSGDRAFFLQWIDDLIAETKADAKRFATVDQKNEVLALYERAREHYRS
jgi:hypothetical protein